jgi:hypothetical protein
MRTAAPPLSSWEDQLRKLQPAVIRSNLVRAGLFLAAWELLKSEVQAKVKDFFLEGFDQKGWIYSASYDTEVVARHKSRFEGSLLWLVEETALSEEQAARIRKLRDHRNEVAHELPKMLLEPGCDVDIALIREIHELIGALGRFWGRIELDINPDFAGREIKDEDVRSGVLVLMTHLVEVVEATPIDPEV